MNSIRKWAEPIVGIVLAGCLSNPLLAAISIEQMLAHMKGQTITGATVVTHGYQFKDSGGDSLIELAKDIRNRIIADTGQNVWLVDYDIGDDGELGVFDDSHNLMPGLGITGQTGQVVFLYDWAPESNRGSRWWAESAGDALFAMMTGMGILNPRYSQAPPLHMIAHSFGSGVNSEAVERMATYRVPVSNMTFLDPHDFDQAGVPVDQDQRIFELGKPSGYGATVWNNVVFADDYYQTRGLQDGIGDIGTDDPEGRPVPGAFNRHLDGGASGGELPPANPNPYDDRIGPEDYESDHGYAWDVFYRATVRGSLPPGGDAAAGTVNYNQTGWAFSVHNPNRPALPAPNFYGPGQDHKHSSAQLQTGGAPNAAGLAMLGLTEQQVVNGRWAPSWTIDQIANGNFAAGSDDFPGTSIDIMAGWTHHGGQPGGYARQEPFEDGVNYFTRMYTGITSDAKRQHNFLYVPLNATHLNFESRVWDGAVDETFNVLLGDTQLGTINVTATDQTWKAQSFAIPQNLRNTVTTLTFELVEGNGGGIFGDAGEVDIDSVRFGIANPQLHSSIMPGSIIDFGVIQGGSSKTIADALALANIGAAGSLLDVFDLSFRNLGSSAGGIFDMTTYAGPFTLAAGGPATSHSIKFQSDNTLGAFNWRMTLGTTVGPVQFLLQGTVIPEPGAMVSLLVALCAGGATHRRASVAPAARPTQADGAACWLSGTRGA